MAESNRPAERETAEPTKRRRTPDALTLMMGLVCIAAAVLTLVGWMPAMPLFDVRWLLAAGAVLVGLLLLAASVRSPKRTRRRG
ncbi:hypothetical protein [Pseudonocardia acaciae]|uniref:hypothetical protein n=1 Tax=Pseudonocardia acaciae TaxID=551276 RepID=UPI000491AF19|nr:hypothetical protein [Pseudonocardia acaciae]